MKIRHPVFVLAALALWALPAASADTIPTTPPPSESPAHAAAEPNERAAPPMVTAQHLYDQANFQGAVDFLTQALQSGQVTGDDVLAARALRGRALVKLGRRLEAKEAFKGVLRSDRAFRLDAAQVPPDEMDSFRLAAQEFDSELAEAGKRFPASIGFAYGKGSAVNQDLVDLASSAGVGAADDFEGSPEFDWSVRFPLKPSISLDIEVQRLKATTHDALPADRNSHADYTSSAMPFVVSLVHNHSHSLKYRLNGFVGAGPMISQALIEYTHTLVSGRLIPAQIVGDNVGWYMHAGLEGEYMVRPRLALSARAIARRANSGKLHWAREDFEIYESYAVSKLGERAVDFSGLALQVGLRAYIGY